MNKTEARFSTTSKGQVAFLLWKDILPDRLDTLEFPLFLYFSQNDYVAIMQSYWRGDSVPACEIGECIYLVDRIIQKGEIVKEFVEEELNTLRDYKEWYTRQVSMDDLLELREEDPDLMGVLEKTDPVFNPQKND